MVTKLFYDLQMEELNLVINGWLLEYELCNENSTLKCAYFVLCLHTGVDLLH